MPGPIHRFLAEDHVRLDGLLRQAVARPDAVDLDAYGQFRAGLLRHIAMEEKVLFVEGRRRRGGEPLPMAARLHDDHAALASLVVPPPTHEIVAVIRDILEAHNPIEEGPGGLYELCDQLTGAEADAVLERLQAIPPVRVSAYRDEPRVHEHVARLLRERARP